MKSKGRLITITETIEENVYKRTVFMKPKESFFTKTLRKLNKKTYTKPSGVGLPKLLKGVIHY